MDIEQTLRKHEMKTIFVRDYQENLSLKKERPSGKYNVTYTGVLISP